MDLQAQPINEQVHKTINVFTTTLLEGYTPKEQREILNEVRNNLTNHLEKVIADRNSDLELANKNLDIFLNKDRPIP